jgi:hypothetical protein
MARQRLPGEAHIFREATQMFETLFTARFSKTLGIGVIAGAALAVASVSSKAADQIQPPPYLTAGMSVVSVSFVWDEAGEGQMRSFE